MSETKQGTDKAVTGVKLGTHKHTWSGQELRGSTSVCSANLDADAMTITSLVIIDKHVDSLAIIFVTFGLHVLLSNIH